MADQFRAHEKNWENVLSGVEIGGHMAPCVLELRDRVAALEAMAKTAAMVVPKTGPALLLPDDAFQAMEAAAARVAPAATADGLSPVEPVPQAPVSTGVSPTAPASAFSNILEKVGMRPVPSARSVVDVPMEAAPQAQQGVTVENLVDWLPRGGPVGYNSRVLAQYLLNHSRIGRLLRGEGAAVTKRVVLAQPSLPEELKLLKGVTGAIYRDGYRTGWAAARAEVERQQGGQADA